MSVSSPRSARVGKAIRSTRGSVAPAAVPASRARPAITRLMPRSYAVARSREREDQQKEEDRDQRGQELAGSAPEKRGGNGIEDERPAVGKMEPRTLHAPLLRSASGTRQGAGEKTASSVFSETARFSKRISMGLPRNGWRCASSIAPKRFQSVQRETVGGPEPPSRTYFHCVIPCVERSTSSQ